MPLTSGSRLGPYEIVSPLGAGGMGEVYRARDTRLDRDVAIKVLPAGLLSDEASRNRFRKEAKALSRLSHPHVATLLDWSARRPPSTTPKCGPQGQVLASNPDLAWALKVYWPKRAAWEDLGPTRVIYPTWRRDGQSFCGLGVEANRIECYSFTTRRLEPRAEIGDMPLLSWVHVPWMGLDADDSPMVMRDRSTRDIYSLDWEAP